MTKEEEIKVIEEAFDKIFEATSELEIRNIRASYEQEFISIMENRLLLIVGDIDEIRINKTQQIIEAAKQDSVSTRLSKFPFDLWKLQNLIILLYHLRFVKYDLTVNN